MRSAALVPSQQVETGVSKPRVPAASAGSEGGPGAGASVLGDAGGQGRPQLHLVNKCLFLFGGTGVNAQLARAECDLAPRQPREEASTCPPGSRGGRTSRAQDCE